MKRFILSSHLILCNISQFRDIASLFSVLEQHLMLFNDLSLSSHSFSVHDPTHLLFNVLKSLYRMLVYTGQLQARGKSLIIMYLKDDNYICSTGFMVAIHFDYQYYHCKYGLHDVIISPLLVTWPSVIDVYRR